MAKPPVRKPKKKVCGFCKDKTAYVDYKDTNMLRKSASCRSSAMSSRSRSRANGLETHRCAPRSTPWGAGGRTRMPSASPGTARRNSSLEAGCGSQAGQLGRRWISSLSGQPAHRSGRRWRLSAK